MSIAQFPLSAPGVYESGQLSFTNPMLDGIASYRVGGGIINGTKTRDVRNTDTSSLWLRQGLVMAFNATNNDWANWSLGPTTAALTSVGTTLTVSAVTATEVTRRIGASGTLKLIGPPVAGGTVRTMSVTYSAVSGTSITITALGVNAVQTVNLVTAATGGSARLIVPKTDGTMCITPAFAWSATDATLLSNLQTALDTATGVVNGIVATAIAATDTDLGFVLTFSGTGYAALPQPMVQVHTLFTSNTGSNVVNTTTGVDGRFISGSVIAETGYATPFSFIKTSPNPIPTSGNVQWGLIPDGGRVDTTALIDYPSDSAFKTWFKQQMSASTGNKFNFSDDVPSA